MGGEGEEVGPPISSTSTENAPIAWTASVWNGTVWSCATSAIARTGWIVPISLFAAITETRIVASVIASSTDAGSTGQTRRPGGR